MLSKIPWAKFLKTHSSIFYRRDFNGFLKEFCRKGFHYREFYGFYLILSKEFFQTKDFRVIFSFEGIFSKGFSNQRDFKDNFHLKGFFIEGIFKGFFLKITKLPRQNS